MGSSVDVTMGRLDASVETVGMEDFVDFVDFVVVLVIVVHYKSAKSVVSRIVVAEQDVVLPPTTYRPFLLGTQRYSTIHAHSPN